MVLYVSHDTMNRLPPLARQRVRDMQIAHDESHLLSAAGAKRLQQISDRANGLRAARDSALASRSGTVFSETAYRELETLEKDEEATRASLAERQRQSREAAALFAAVERWLTTGDMASDHLTRSRVELVDVPLPKVEGDLAEVRKQISDLDRRRMEISRAPLPRADLEARLRSEVKTMAARGKPGVAVDRDGRVSVRLPSANPLSVLAWLDPDAVVNRLLADLPKPTPNALSAEQKRKAIEEIDVEKLELERVEEALVRASPVPVARRANADVRALLSVDARPVRAKEAA